MKCIEHGAHDFRYKNFLTFVIKQLFLNKFLFSSVYECIERYLIKVILKQKHIIINIESNILKFITMIIFQTQKAVWFDKNY